MDYTPNKKDPERQYPPYRLTRFINYGNKLNFKNELENLSLRVPQNVKISTNIAEDVNTHGIVDIVGFLTFPVEESELPFSPEVVYQVVWSMKTSVGK